MLRPRRLPVLQPAATPSRSGGAQTRGADAGARRRCEVTPRRPSIDGGSGSTGIRSSVVRCAVGCRRRRSPVVDARRTVGQSGGMVLLPACGFCLMTALRNRISACEQVSLNATSGLPKPGPDRIAQFPLRVRRLASQLPLDRIVRAVRPRFARRLGFRPVQALLSSADGWEVFRSGDRGRNDQLAALECLKEAPVRIGGPTPSPEDIGRTARTSLGGRPPRRPP
jgi:hypothetical protein